MTDSSTEKKTTARVKPMTATERKALTTLIDNDFVVLKNEVRMYGNELKAAEIARINAEYEGMEEQARAAENQWDELRRDLQMQVDAFIAEKRAAGLFAKIAGQGGYNDDRVPARFRALVFDITARDRALKEAENAVERQVMTALNELERKRIQVQREVLTSALVTEEARNLLDAQPDPRTLLEEAVNGPGRLLSLRPAAVQQIEGRAEVQEIREPGIHIPEVMDR